MLRQTSPVDLDFRRPLGSEVDLCLAVLTGVADGAILLPAHDALQLRQVLAQVHHLALDQQRGSLGRGPQIDAVQSPGDVPSVPKALARDGSDGHACAHVEDEGDGAAVQVAAGIAQGAGDEEFEGGQADVAVGGRDGCRHQLEVVAHRGIKVLGDCERTDGTGSGWSHTSGALSAM